MRWGRALILRMTITIDRIKESDYDEWILAWKAYLTFYKTTLTDADHKDTFARLIDLNGNIEGFIARDDGKLVGITHYLFHSNTWTSKPVCYLNDLYVNEDCRGKGVGRKLIMAVHEQAKLKDCSTTYWTTQYENKTAQALYNKLATTEFIKYKMSP